MIIIGTGGKIGAGKTTLNNSLAVYIKRMRPSAIVGYSSISAPLKRMAVDMIPELAAMNGIYEDVNLKSVDIVADGCGLDFTRAAKNLKIGDATVGSWLQSMGASVRNSLGRHSIISPVVTACQGCDFLILDGIRYKSDIEYIKLTGRNNVTIRIESEYLEPDLRPKDHESELLMPSDFDFIIRVRKHKNNTMFRLAVIEAIAASGIDQILAVDDVVCHV